MFKIRAIDEEKNFSKNRFLNALFPTVWVAHADAVDENDDNYEEADFDDAPAPNATTAKQPRVNYEELISNARKEEKKKLYPEIKRLRSENGELLKKNNELLLEAASLRKELDAANSVGAAMSEDEKKKLTDEIAELKTELEGLKANPVDEASIRAKVEGEYAVQLYIRDKLAEYKDEILPVFTESITGATNDEVDAAIEKAKKQTIDAKIALGLLNPDGSKKDEPILTPQTQPVRPVVANPSGSKVKTGMTLQELQNIDPRSPEYAAFRKAQGLK